MALFADNLEQALGKQAASQSAQINDTYNQQKKRLVAQQAASGRLMSGVSDYPLGDLETSRAGDLSGVQTSLDTALAGVPTEDWLNNQDFQRKLDLTNYIGSLMKPSTLDEVLAGIGTGLKVGGSAAAVGGLI